ncbi:MAG: hypothetical protein WCX61_04455 [Candidatus Peribacteraceae bacterium]
MPEIDEDGFGPDGGLDECANVTRAETGVHTLPPKEDWTDPLHNGEIEEGRKMAKRLQQLGILS